MIVETDNSYTRQNIQESNFKYECSADNKIFFYFNEGSEKDVRISHQI